MNRATLEKLAANPHYKMTQAQIEELNRLRRNDENTVPIHTQEVRKTDPGIVAPTLERTHEGVNKSTLEDKPKE